MKDTLKITITITEEETIRYWIYKNGNKLNSGMMPFEYDKNATNDLILDTISDRVGDLFTYKEEK